MRPLSTASRTLLALTVAAAFGGFAATAIRDGLQAPARAEPAPPAAITAVPAMAALPTAVEGVPVPSLAPMLQRVTPAVVSVRTKQVVRVSPFGGDPVFRRMFPELSQEQLNQSLGSGVIVDAQRGYVLTNHHVIEGADEVSITLADGRTAKAEFVGSDADTDVALMKIDVARLGGAPLTALRLADSSALQVGDFVVAVGNPFGVGQTVTSGIVSAVGRANVPGIGFQNFIQTDASINPGNSGGALVNLRGELVGINTASFNPQGSMAGNIGLGFAIPANLAASVQRQLEANGEVRRGTLGVETQDVTDRLAPSLGLSEARGAAVTRVYPGSAGAAAGLQPGDVILAANGERIDSGEALRNFQGLQAADARISLDVRRAGKPLTLSATLREQARALDGATIDPRLAGAMFVEVPEAIRRNGLSGVLVEKVAAGSRAAQNGLRAGDLVVAASSGDFADLPGFRASLSQRPAQLAVRIVRGSRQGQLGLN